jgi:hypothetical protein
MATLNPNAYAVQGLGSDQFPLKMAPALPGQVVNSNAFRECFTRYNSGTIAIDSASDMTVAGTIGTATFTLTFVVTGLIGVATTKVITYTAVSGNTATDVAAALVSLINADETLNDVLVASNAAGVISFLIRRFRKVTSITGAATGSATLTAASTITQDGTPTEIPFGYVVGAYPTFGDDQCSAISTASNLTVLGLAAHRFYDVAEFPYDANKATRGYPAQALVEIVTRGLYWVPVAGAVTKNTVPAFLNATGQLTTNGAGSSTAFTGALYKSDAPAGGLAIVSLNLAPGV